MQKITTQIHPIDAMPNLSARLGKVGCARIRFAMQGVPPAPRRGKRLANPFLVCMRDLEPYMGGPVDDILSGIATLDWGTGKPLSPGLLHVLLQSLEVVTTDAVCAILALQQRQAQRYVKALELALPHLAKHFGAQPDVLCTDEAPYNPVAIHPHAVETHEPSREFP